MNSNSNQSIQDRNRTLFLRRLSLDYLKNQARIQANQSDVYYQDTIFVSTSSYCVHEYGVYRIDESSVTNFKN
jgi:hypothetical protein